MQTRLHVVIGFEAGCPSDRLIASDVANNDNEQLVVHACRSGRAHRGLVAAAVCLSLHPTAEPLPSSLYDRP